MKTEKAIPKLKKAFKMILPLYLIIKIFAALLSILTLGGVDLTFINPALELSFYSLIFVKYTSEGLTIFIAMITMIAVGVPLSFFIISDRKILRYVGLIAYCVIVLMDVVSIFVMGFGDGRFILSLVIDLLMILCLLLYGKYCLLSFDTDSVSEAPEDKNNP